MHTFYIENDAEIFPAHYTWKVAENGFNKVFMMNKLAMTLVKLFLKNKNTFFCQISFWNSGAHYTCMRIILDKILYTSVRVLISCVTRSQFVLDHNISILLMLILSLIQHLQCIQLHSSCEQLNNKSSMHFVCFKSALICPFIVGLKIYFLMLNSTSTSRVKGSRSLLVFLLEEILIAIWTEFSTLS